MKSLVTVILFLAAAVIVSAQNPGDKVEYRTLRWPETWDVGTFVRALPETNQVVIRTAPTVFNRHGAERTYAANEVRLLKNVGPPPREFFPLPGAGAAPPESAPAPLPQIGPPPKEFFVVRKPSAAPAAPAPAAAPAAPPAPVFPACGARPNPTMNRLECVQQVQSVSTHWAGCHAGNGVACHRFVREVARALAAGDARWGLITKPRGQQACTEQACGRDITGGYGEDMVAYLPAGHAPNQWLGGDIVGGAGAPGARVLWPNPAGYATNRPDNLWSVVPPR